MQIFAAVSSCNGSKCDTCFSSLIGIKFLVLCKMYFQNYFANKSVQLEGLTRIEIGAFPIGERCKINLKLESSQSCILHKLWMSSIQFRKVTLKL